MCGSQNMDLSIFSYFSFFCRIIHDLGPATHKNPRKGLKAELTPPDNTKGTIGIICLHARMHIIYKLEVGGRGGSPQKCGQQPNNNITNESYNIKYAITH